MRKKMMCLRRTGEKNIKRIRRRTAFVLTAALCLTCCDTVFADTVELTDSDWEVSFDGKEMHSNFDTNATQDSITGVMPGDTVVYSVDFRNDYAGDTDWYLSNDVTQTLEESHDASGGAYTYRLEYLPADGSAAEVLYDSDTVGGDDETLVGLYQATDSTDEFFHLDRCAEGEGGTVQLTIVLDGLTQDNSYMSALGALNLQFAVEIPEGETREITKERKIYNTTTPKTGDVTLPLILSGIAAGLGVLLIVVWCILTAKRRKEEGAN